jgi:hypothetical protein
LGAKVTWKITDMSRDASYTSASGKTYR